MNNDIENQMTNNEIKKICCLSCAVYTSITVLCVIAIHAFYNSIVITTLLIPIFINIFSIK
jgi:hypothetical protein